ncbi:MAG TPA: hypothetical protein VM686_08935 [Polyangiaceae bacterium]|nr:hypothetical protein [Polyangiaceae bacterium]
MLAAALATLVAFLPNLLAALIILAIGLLIASLCGRLVRRALMAVGIDRRRSLRQFFGHEETIHRAPEVAGKVVYWVLALVTIGMAIDALRLTWLSLGVAAVLAYLPSALAAAAIVLVGYLLGNYLYRKVVQSATASIFWAQVVRIAVFVFAGFMAVQQLGIATAIVTVAFTLVLGAMAVAGAVAFGLGNRELAGRITQDWYERQSERFHIRDLTETEREFGERPHH